MWRVGLELLNRSCVNSLSAIIPLWAVTTLISRSHPLHLLFLQIVLNASECLKLIAVQVPCADIRTTKLVLSLAQDLVICKYKEQISEDVH